MSDYYSRAYVVYGVEVDKAKVQDLVDDVWSHLPDSKKIGVFSPRSEFKHLDKILVGCQVVATGKKGEYDFQMDWRVIPEVPKTIINRVKKYLTKIGVTEEPKLFAMGYLGYTSQPYSW